jgi:uncharacterized damage-inducible protein DinB
VKKTNLTVVCALAAVLAVTPLFAQMTAPSANPLTDAIKSGGDRAKDMLLKSAEQMPEADYAFKPTPEVRSFGQILAHVADANTAICGAVIGEKPGAVSAEKTAVKKADIQKALTDSFAVCDKAFASVTDATAAQPVSFFGRQMPKLAVLAFNVGHDYEHYGNVVTYLRLKGLVPPSSQPKK